MKRLSIIVVSLSVLIFCFIGYNVCAHSDLIEMKLISDVTINNLKTRDGTQYLINGDFMGSFYSDVETSAVMTVSMAALEDNRYALIFFNQTSENQEITYDNAPPISRAIGGDAVSVGNTASSNTITSDSFREYTFSVKIKKGINTVYIPKYEITDDCGNLRYTKNGVKCNSLVCFKSITFDIKDIGQVVYTADIPMTNLSHYDEKDAVNGVFNKSYMGSDEKGYTNIYSSLEGAFVSYPFSVEKSGDYFLKVYYAACEKNSPAVMHLDCDMNKMPPVNLWQTANAVTGSALDRQAAVQNEIDKFTAGSTEYRSGIWSYTGTLWDYVNNSEQNADSWMTYRKAPYFSIKTFELKNLSAGEHLASFIVQSFENSDTGKTDYQNNGVLINRIEVIEQNTDIDVDVNTYVTSEPGERVSKTQINGWDNGVHHVTVLSDAKNIIENKNANVRFNVEFINNTENTMVYDCYVAQYNKIGELLSCNSIGDITVIPDKNVTVTRTYEMKRDALNEETSLIKMLVWDKKLTPVHQVTELNDNYSMQDIRVSDGFKLSESFKKDVFEYGLNIDSATHSVGIIAYCDDGAQLYINGNLAKNGEETVVSKIPCGESQIVVSINIGATELAQYIINVYRENLAAMEIPVSQAEYKYTEYDLDDGLWTASYASTNSSLGLSGIGGGGIIFRFNSPVEQEVKITVNCWRGQPNSDPIVAFFNPIATPDEYTFTMAEGIDYPPLSEAKIINTTWSNGIKQLLNLEMVVQAAEGVNTVWFPSRALARNTGDGKTTECMYLVNPKNSSSYANRQTIISSISVQPTISTVTKIMAD